MLADKRSAIVVLSQWVGEFLMRIKLLGQFGAFLIVAFSVDAQQISADSPQKPSEPVDPAEHRILLVEQGRDAVPPCRKQGWECRIAAEADHRRGQEGLVEPERHRPAGQDAPRRIDT